MDAREVETRIADGEPALQALILLARATAGTLEAHEAEQGLFRRLLPRGWAAMPLACAQRGTGDVGPAVRQADGGFVPREQQLRGRDDGSRFGKCAVRRPGDRTPGEAGIVPRDAQGNLPERCDSSGLPAWMTGVAVEPPVQERAGCFGPRCALAGAESVLLAVAQDAPQDSADCSAQRSLSPADTAGELWVVSCDGTGVPLLKAEAVKLQAKLGTGATRQRKQAARVGVSSPVAPQPRAPAALAARLVDPAAARTRRQRAGTRDEAPRAQQVRRVASLVRTKPAGRQRLKADAERRDPPHRQPWVLVLDGARCLWRLAPQRVTPWQRVTCGLDSMPVGGDLWAAANAVFGEAAKAGQHWVQHKLTAIRSGRVGDGIGGLRQRLTPQRLRQSLQQTLAQVITFLHNHRRWMKYDQYLALGLPVGTGVVASACGSVVKPRMEGEGPRWSLAGAAASLALRSLKKSHANDRRDSWRGHARQVRLRLYGRQATSRPTARLKRVASPDSKRLRSPEILRV
jgi:hypothetical protein